MGSWATGDDSASASRWPRRLLLAALAVVVLLACAGTWLVMHTGGGFDRQLAAIRARGEPVTLEELHAYPAPLPAELDATDLWLRAAEAVVEAQRAPVARRLPLLGDGSGPPPLGQPWAERELIEQFLTNNAEAVRLMHAAADRGGQARFKIPNASTMSGTDLDQLQALRGCARMLQLETMLHIRSGDADHAAESIRAGLLLSQSLESAPLAVSQLIRIALFAAAAGELKTALPMLDWTDDDLSRLQSTLGAIDFKPAVKAALIGERVQAMNMFSQWAGGRPWQRLLGEAILGADRVRYLEVMAQMIEVTELPWPDFLVASDALVLKVNSGGTSARNVLTRMMIPGLQTTTTAFARAELTRRVLVLAVALERYRRQEGHPAADLAALVPQYLAVLPDDLTTGKAFLYRSGESSYVVYSPTQRFEMGKDERADPETGAYPACMFRWPPAEVEISNDAPAASDQDSGYDEMETR